MGFAAPAAREVTAGVEGVVAVGEAAEVAEGVMGVVGTWVEPSRLAVEVEVGVTAVDGLRENRKRKKKIQINPRSLEKYELLILCVNTQHQPVIVSVIIKAHTALIGMKAIKSNKV